MAAYERGPFEIQLNVTNLFGSYYALEVQKDTDGKKTYSPAEPRNFIVQIKYMF
jgi:iron complex outermembrane receptor protein